MKNILIFFGLCFLIVSCQKFEAPTNNKIRKKIEIDVIYGTDDRVDLFELDDSNWYELAQSTVALIDHKRVENYDKDFYQLAGPEFGKSFHLCTDEPFFSQPSVAFCSGFLVGPEIVVTAGHCIRNEFNCENVRMVFGYNYESDSHNPQLIPKKNVYKCKELIHTETNGLTGSDFAIMRLNKPVPTHSPLPIRTQGTLTTDDPLTVIGYPSGIPAKLAHGGVIRNTDNEAYVVTTLDTYGGNSGSAVFNTDTRLVEGILVRGDTDFVFDQVDRCRRSNVCQSTECRGEDVVRIDRILEYLSPSDLSPRSQNLGYKVEL